MPILHFMFPNNGLLVSLACLISGDGRAELSVGCGTQRKRSLSGLGWVGSMGEEEEEERVEMERFVLRLGRILIGWMSKPMLGIQSRLGLVSALPNAKAGKMRERLGGGLRRCVSHVIRGIRPRPQSNVQGKLVQDYEVIVRRF